MTWSRTTYSCEPDYKKSIDKSTHSGVKPTYINIQTADIPHERRAHVRRRAPASDRRAGDQQGPRIGHRARPGVRRHHRDRAARPRRPRQGRRGATRARRRRARRGRCTSSSPASASARPPAPTTRTRSPRPPSTSSPCSGATRAAGRGHHDRAHRGAAAHRPRARRRHQLRAHRRPAGRHADR